MFGFGKKDNVTVSVPEQEVKKTPRYEEINTVYLLDGKVLTVKCSASHYRKKQWYFEDVVLQDGSSFDQLFLPVEQVKMLKCTFI